MGTPALWIGFNAGVLLLLLLDLGVFHRRASETSVRAAAGWSVFWVALSLGFNLWILHEYGGEKALQFFAGYLIEKSLSLDNIFIFLLIFKSFRVEPRYQHRVLFWGVLGALVLRGIMIALGAVLIRRFEWILYVLGAFLMVAAIRMFLHKDREPHPERNSLLRWVQKVFPVSSDYHGQSLFIREAGRLMATKLLLVLLVIEGVDVAFAVDSIPAVFGITRDPFIVFSSNVCAILGLRAFYFLLAGALPYFRYLDEGLSFVLMFVGAKMLAAHWIEIPTALALVVIATILGIALLFSILAASKEKKENMEKDKLPATTIYRDGHLTEISKIISELSSSDSVALQRAILTLFAVGGELGSGIIESWAGDAEFSSLLPREAGLSVISDEVPQQAEKGRPRATVGVAVLPEHFERIRKANGSPPLASVPPDQDALEFELYLAADYGAAARIDILTTNQPGGEGAIAKFLTKFGEGIQQVEYEVIDVDRATQVLAEKFGQKAIYPATRPGADGTRVNFFLVPTKFGKKMLIELVEPRK